MFTPQYQANLGNSALLSKTNYVTNQYGKNGLADGNFQSVFDSPKVESETCIEIFNIVTDMVSYELPSGGPSARYLAVLGRLEFGIGGASMSVDFDWKVGSQISVAASYIRLSACYSGTGSEVPDSVKVQAMLASGSRASRAQTTRTFPKLHVDTTHVQVFPIPPFAHALNIFSSFPAFYTGSNVQIRYVGGASAGSNAASTDLVSWVSNGAPFLAALGNEDGVRFPEMARYVEITSGDATGYDFVPCFTLSL